MPVLLEPVLKGLNLKPDGFYVDGTFGRGGHSSAILSELGPQGRLLAIDRDPEAIAAVMPSLLADPRFELAKGEIAELEKYAFDRKLLGKVDGLLLDLGVSSPQLDEAGRGFSFRTDGPLDMRMDPTAGTSAADWLATVDEKKLKKVLSEYGEENQAGRIARAIVARRSLQPLTRTGELGDLIASLKPAHGQRRHPATKSFQAIRIFVNDELGQLKAALAASIKMLRSGGRLCVISFHSLEDRLVKRFMRDSSLEPEPYRGLPHVPAAFRPPLRRVGAVIKATDAEIRQNVRARSARLRVAERL